MRIEDAGTGMVLTRDVVDERGNLLLEKGITLTRTYITRLKRLGVSAVSVADPYAETLKRNKVISDVLRDELRTCFSALFCMKAADILNFRPPTSHLEKVNAVVERVIDEAAGRLDCVVNVQIRQPSDSEEHHAVNVCLLAVATGLYLKYERSVLRELALGALLHDLGKSMLPAEDADKAFLHTIYGRELILRSNLCAAAARVAAEHHEAFDGSGHPKGLTAKDVHPLSRLVSIANYFDSAAEANSWGGDLLTPQELLATMTAAGNRLFDANLLRAFFSTAAIVPVGSLVRLSTGRTGYVVANRPHFPLRPVVRVVEETEHTDIDLALKPNLAIVGLVGY